jgi:hypothetical protein
MADAIKNKDKKRFLVAYKGGKCFDCGREFPDCCMDFDHRDISQKSFNLARLRHTIKEMMAEADKCDLVCACCHRIRTKNNPAINASRSAALRGRGVGRVRSPEDRARMREGLKGIRNAGNMVGKKHSSETRAKLSESLKRYYAKRGAA